jgi:hypothetical protein
MNLHGADAYRNIEYHDAIFGYRELEGMLCGDIINTGSSRRVYQCNLNRDWVVKREIANTRQNVIEYEIWEFAETQDGKWLAPCHFMSANGLFLIQSKTTPLRAEERPKRLPAFLTCDLKLENFGWLDGRIVCHDYGTLVASIKRHGTNLKPAKWHDL